MTAAGATTPVRTAVLPAAVEVPAVVEVEAIRPWVRELALLFTFAALIAAGRAVCLLVQGCAHLFPYDVPRRPAALR